MPILPPTLVAKLDPLIRRLASIHDGEVVATARAIERRLRAARFDLNDLAETVRQQAPPFGATRAAAGLARDAQFFVCGTDHG